MQRVESKTTPAATTARRLRRQRIVIADAGDRVDLVLLPPGHPVAPGSRFGHRGRWWEIRGRRQHSRVLVANPLIPRTS